MKKIISLFKRDYEKTKKVFNEVTPGAGWVIEGEGKATRKWDGTCCLVKDGELYKRYELRKGKEYPFGFIPAQDPDPVTGECPGWVKVDPNNPENKWHLEAWKRDQVKTPDGTYELCGPKVNGNNDNLLFHVLIPHGRDTLRDVPTDFDGLRTYLNLAPIIEGIVWHHPDGRMVKIKKKDF